MPYIQGLKHQRPGTVERGLFERPDSINAPLYVVTPVFNAQRFRSRLSLDEKYEKYINDSGAILYKVELAYGERAFSVTDPNNPRHIQLRTGDIYDVGDQLWFKENMINLAVQRLPSDWRYMAWIDGDVQFARPDWVGETLHQLQTYHVVQMFSEAYQLTPDYNVQHRYQSFAHWYHNEYNVDNLEIPPLNSYNCKEKNSTRAKWSHPGFAWAIRRDAFDHLGGLIDWAGLGSADWYMCRAFAGFYNIDYVAKSLGVSGCRMLTEWQSRSEKYLKRNIGYVEGALLHYWHGQRKDRNYRGREQFLIEAGFEPDLDLKRDWQGLWQLTNRSCQLRDGIRKYFKQRNEDNLEQ
jgi:hypothetical protein